MQYKPFPASVWSESSLSFIEVWVKSNSPLMLVTYLTLFPIFHLQCIIRTYKSQHRGPQTTRNEVHVTDKLLMVRVESSLFAVVGGGNFRS